MFLKSFDSAVHEVSVCRLEARLAVEVGVGSAVVIVPIVAMSEWVTFFFLLFVLHGVLGDFAEAVSEDIPTHVCARSIHGHRVRALPGPTASRDLRRRGT